MGVSREMEWKSIEGTRFGNWVVLQFGPRESAPFVLTSQEEPVLGHDRAMDRACGFMRTMQLAAL
jgi:hypothetical protein